jgi:methionyl-tRNA formyltransferase
MAPERPEPRIVVFAYSEVGARCLELLLARGQHIAAVYTHEDDPHEPRWFRSVAEIAQAHGLAVECPERLRELAVIDALRALRPELIFSFYYRLLIPRQILALPRLGAFNMHGSLLPRYRGRAPVNWAILNGERETGVTLHHMVARADAGDIVDQQAVPIGPEDSAADLMARITEAAALVLDRRLEELLRGCAPRRPQDEALATTFGRRTAEDGRIDWAKSSAEVANLVRAVSRPFPGAFTEASGRRLYVWRARALPAAPTPAGALAPAGVAGQVLCAAPLRVAAGSGVLEIADWSWEGPARPAPAGASLEPPRLGSVLGVNGSTSAAPAGSSGVKAAELRRFAAVGDVGDEGLR